MIELIDSHIHLDDERFAEDRTQLIAQAQTAGVKHFVLPAVAVNRFEAVRELAESHPSVHAAYGLHPYYIEQHQPEDLVELEVMLDLPNVVAVGECGLDYYLKDLDREQQMAFFAAQVGMAQVRQLPLILHVRGAVDAVYQVLKKQRYFNAVMHSFNGSKEQAKALIKAGVMLGFGAAVCHPKATKLRQLIEFVPIEHMLLETDAPDQPFYDRYGQRNLPVDLLRVNQQIAEIKGIEPAVLAAQTVANTRQLFKL